VHPRAKRATVGLALLALCCAACATTTAEVRPEGPEVKDIRIQGADKLDEGDIKKKILTSESGLGFWPFGDKAYFDPNAWQADLRRIERFYQAQGYYQAEVVSDEVIPEGKNGVELLVKVKEGEPTRIAQVNLHGLDALPPEHREAVKKALVLHEGEIFQEDNWAGQKAALQAVLKEKGYVDAAVEGEVHVDVQKRTADVEIEIRPGQRYRFGKIFVSNDPTGKISNKRIIDQASGAIKEKDWYSESAIAEAQARVFKMGVFGGVKVNRAAPDRAEGSVPVVVDVREAPFHTQKVGFGVGVDQTRNEARVIGEYTDRNFFGDLRRLTLRARVGYALLPGIFALGPNGSGITNSGVIGNLAAEVEQPRFLFRDVRGQVSLTFERDIQPAYQYLGGRARAGIIWQPHPDFSVYPSLNFEGYRLEALQNSVVGSGNTSSLVLGCQAARPGEPCYLPLFYAEEVIEWDRRDDRIGPHKGFYLSLSLQEGGGPLSSFTYLRVLPDARFYTSFLDNRFTLAVKLRVGTLLAGKNTATGEAESPIVSRFFSGGNFMRGFGDRRLSPLEVLPPSSTDANCPNCGQTVPIGGNGLFEGSVELRYAVTEKLVVAGFLDTGFVTRESFDFASPRSIANNMQYAVGVGIRYNTIVGPIRVDLATRVAGPPLQVSSADPAYVANVHRGCFFGIGENPGRMQTDYTSYASYPGSPESLCSFQLSIGEAF